MNETSPIKSLIDTHPEQAIYFLDGSSTIRKSLSSRKYHDAYLFWPLRGAMPIFWAASGDPEIEKPLDQKSIELPIGLYRRTNSSGEDRTTSPQGSEKQRIISSAISSIYDENHDVKICLIDEVQKGGTITIASSITRNCMERLGIRPPLYVFAAQDSRSKVVNEKKTHKYEILASNGERNIEANVIAMPLIATDRNSLLDEVFLTNNQETMQFIVKKNARAERLIRGIGTMARCAVIRYDETYIRDLVDDAGSGSLDEHHSVKLEKWIAMFIKGLSTTAKRPRPNKV